MFETFFKKYPSFKIDNKESSLKNHINKFNKLPNELITFIDTYGTGTYMNGFLKFIDPKEYQEVLDNAYLNTDGEIVFAITAFGDFLLWIGDAIRLVKFKYGTYKIIESGDDMDWFFNMDLAEDSYVKSHFEFDLYKKAKQELGELKFDECFGFVPLLSLGGSEKIENIQKVKIKEHISLIYQMNGKIE